MDELTIADLEGRRIWERLGRRAARSLRNILLELQTGVCVTKSDTYKEAPVKSLASLTFDGVMRGTPLSGVSSSGGFALGLRIGRTQRVGRRISCGRSGRLIRGESAKVGTE